MICARAWFLVLLGAAALEATGLGAIRPQPALAAAGAGDLLAGGAGARERVLGGTTVADPAAALGWNPARLAAAEGLLIHAHLAPLPEGGSLDAVGVAWPLGPGVLGGSLTRLGVGGIATFDAQGIPTGSADFGDQELAAGYALGLPWPFGGAGDGNGAPADGAGVTAKRPSFSPRMDLGAALRLRRQSFASQSGAGLGLDLGLNLSPRHGWSLGMRARNLLSPTLTVASEAERLPRSLALGGAWTRGMMGRSLLFAGEVEVGDAGEPFALGVEIPIAGAVLGRAGVHGSDYRLGFGFAASFFALDYGLEAHELGLVHVVSVTARLGQGSAELKAKAQAAAAANQAAVATAAAEQAITSTVENLRTKARAAPDREAARAAWLALSAHRPGDAEAVTALNAITAGEAQETASWRDSLQTREQERRAAVQRLTAASDSLALARRDLSAQETMLNDQETMLAVQRADLTRLEMLLRALEAFAAGQRERAAAIADSLSAAYPNDPDVLALRAQLEPSAAHLDPARRAEARNLYVEGMRRFNAGDYAGAIRYWEQLLALDPANQAVRMNLDEARARQGGAR